MEQLQATRSQYRQIADLLRERVETGVYPVDEPLPSEPELATELGVSRVTINKAMGLLRTAGLVRVRRGAGTYVRATPRITRDARYRYASSHPRASELEGRALGLHPHAKCTRIGRLIVGEDAPVEVGAALDLDPGTPVVVRHRTIYADDEPTRLAASYIPWDIAAAADLLEADVGSSGAYAQLAEFGHGPVRFAEEVMVRVASDAEARALDLEDGQAVIHITHLAWDAEDRPIEVALHVMPAHLWRLRYDWDDPTSEELPESEAPVF